MSAARIPFLTRFFRAWAGDVRIPVTAPPDINGFCGGEKNPQKEAEKSRSTRT